MSSRFQDDRFLRRSVTGIEHPAPGRALILIAQDRVPAELAREVIAFAVEGPPVVPSTNEAVLETSRRGGQRREIRGELGSSGGEGGVPAAVAVEGGNH